MIGNLLGEWILKCGMLLILKVQADVFVVYNKCYNDK